MNRYSTCLRIVLTLLLVLSGVSASHAGLFGRWRARYDSQPYVPAAAPSGSPAPSAPAVGKPAASTTGPVVYTVAKPIAGKDSGVVAPSVPQTRPYYAPTVNSGTSWSTIPRSAWDFGKFPPYSN